jgi:hypothetical protein
MGTYRISDLKPTAFHAWRPIYRNNEGKFLYYCADKKMWIVGSDFCEDSGQLMSDDAEFPQEASKWKVRNGSEWTSGVFVKVTGQGGGIEQRNQDGIKLGDVVCINTGGAHMNRFSQGERGRVVQMCDARTARIQFEKRPGTVPVATWLLHVLPEGLSRSCDYDLLKSHSVNYW